MKTIKTNRNILIPVGNVYISTRLIRNRLESEKILTGVGISSEYQIGKNDSQIILIDRDMYEYKSGRRIIDSCTTVSDWIKTDKAFAEAYLMSYRK